MGQRCELPAGTAGTTLYEEAAPIGIGGRRCLRLPSERVGSPISIKLPLLLLRTGPSAAPRS